MVTLLKKLWRKLFPFRGGLSPEQTEALELELKRLRALKGTRHVNAHLRGKLQELQAERQRLRAALTWYAKNGHERERAREALAFVGDNPYFWRTSDGRTVMEAYTESLQEEK